MDSVVRVTIPFDRGVHANVGVRECYWVPQIPRWGHPTPRSTGRKFGRLT